MTSLVHPGHALMWLGTAVAVLGTSLVVATVEEQTSGNRFGEYSASFGCLALGAIWVADGIGNYSASVKALHTRATLKPSVAPTRGGGVVGLSVAF